MKQLVLEEIKSKAIPVLKKAGVKKAAVFGSVARGEETSTSDIDILIDTPSHMSLFGFVGLELELQDVLGQKVDLVDEAGIKPRLKPYIMKDQIAIL